MTTFASLERVVVFDHGLGSLSGHWVHFDRLVSDQARARGMAVRIFGHREVRADMVGDLQVTPLFSVSPGARLSDNEARNMRLRNRSFLRGLARVGRTGFGPSDLFLFPCVMNHELEAVLRYAHSFDVRTRPLFLLLMQFDNGLGAAIPSPAILDLPFVVRFDRWLKRGVFRRDPAESCVPALYRKALRSGGGRPARTAFMAPSGGLDERLRQILDVPVGSYCMPGPTPAEMGAGHEDRRPIADGTIRVAYLGPACFRKGSHLLPDVIRGIRGRHRHVRFDVQVNPEPGARLDGVLDEAPAGATYHRGHLDSDRYYEVARRADIVLLPYSPADYRFMPSGVLREALALGKIVVLPAGTSLERQAESVGAGVVAYDEWSVRGLTVALDRAVSDRRALGARAADAAGRWVARHNPVRFMDDLLEYASLAA